jgi:ATP-binding cassette subfamily F protein 3
LLEEVLLRFSGSLVFVSHDRYLINKIATRIGEITDGQLALYEGDYDYLLQEKNRSISPEKKRDDTAGSAKEDFRMAKRLRNEHAAKERRVKAIEEEIGSLEREIAEIEADMAAVGTEHDRLHRLQTDKNALNQRIDILFEEWEALNAAAFPP